MNAVRESTCPLVLSAINQSRGALCLTASVASEDPCLIYASGTNINVFDVPSFNLRQVIDLSAHLPQSWSPSLHGVEAVCATENKLAVASGPYVVVFSKSKSRPSEAIWNLHSSFTSGLKRITSIILKGNDCLLIAEDGVSLYEALEPVGEGGFVTIPRWVGRWSTHADSCTDADFFRSSDGRCHIASYVADRPILHFYSSRTSNPLAEIYEMSYRRLSLSSAIRSIRFAQSSMLESEETYKTLYVSLYNRFAGVHTHIYNLEVVPDDEAPSNLTTQSDLQPGLTVIHPSHQGVINCPAFRSHRVIQTFYLDSKHIATLLEQENPFSRCSMLSILSNGYIHVSREPSLIRPPSSCSELYRLPSGTVQLLADPNVMIHGITRTKNVDQVPTVTFLIIFARSASSVGQLCWHEIPLGTFTSGLLCCDSVPINSASAHVIPHGLSIIPASDGASDILVATSPKPVSNPVTFFWCKVQYRNNGPLMHSLSDISFDISNLRVDVPINAALTSNDPHVPTIAEDVICSVGSSTQWWIHLSLSQAQTEAALRVRLVAPKNLSPAPFVSEFALTGLQPDERIERYASTVKEIFMRDSTSHWFLEIITSLNRLLVWELPALLANTDPVHHEPKVALRLPSLIAELESQIRISFPTTQSYSLVLAAGNDGNVLQFKQSYGESGESDHNVSDKKEWTRLVSVRHILGSSADTCTLLNFETKSSYVALLYFISSPSNRKSLKLILVDLRVRSFGSGIVCAEEMPIDPEDDQPADTNLKWSADTMEPNSEKRNSKPPLLAVAYGGFIKVYSCGADGRWKGTADVRPKNGSAHVVSWVTVNGQRSLIYQLHGHLYASSGIPESRHPQMPYWHPIRLKNHLDFGDFESVSEVINTLATALDGKPQALRLVNSPNLLSTRDINLITNESSKKDYVASFGILGSTISPESLDIVVRSASESRIPSLTPEEQKSLADMTLQLFTIQTSFSGIDELGCRYLFSLVSHLSSSNQSQTDVGFGDSQDPDILLAYHSSCQALLATQVIDNVAKYASLSNPPVKCTLDWKLARKVGLFLWLKPQETLLSTLELVAQQEYQSISESSQINVTREVNRDPAACSVFYMALRKKRLLLGLWRVAYGHPDRPHMLKFLANDFDEPRWKTAAQKNAFALISRQRFGFAASFFLLADRLQDAVNVCVRQLADWSLGIAIARAYEGDNGPVLRSLLRDTVIPQGFLDGNRWILSWAFDMLGEKDLASRILVSSLEDIARTDILKPISTDLIHEQPGPLSMALVVMFNTVRKQDQVPSTNFMKENELAMLTIKRLLEAGCDQLAYCVARTWRFQSQRRMTSQINSDNVLDGPTTSKLERPSSGDTAQSTVTIDQDTKPTKPENPPKTRVLKQVVVPEFDLSNF